MYGNFLAPIHEYTDFGFRMLCQRYGAEATCVPLVNATAIARDKSKVKLVDARLEERNLGVQLVDGDPSNIGVACKMIDDAFPFISWYNLNCGCPSSRTMDCGGGSAMLKRPERIFEAVALMKKAVDKPLSVKLRIKDGFDVTLGLCEGIAEAGGDFIILHARTPGQIYSGRADWGLLKRLKQELDVPLVGNGDIGSASEGKGKVDDGFCDSYMVGRAAMANPLLFSDKRLESLDDRFGILDEYISLCIKHGGEAKLKDVRLKATNFLSGVRYASLMRDRINRADSIEGILKLKNQ
jgi:tRNA-dihydrouridine synthase B